ncbi:hypothetical protein AYK20_07135 [Thermoplasmatales archaeon SG8-52-1]|nr:MAG: hypothetical protein AYK20_07135 [Thermoplasmatales archaeon SG8-52-1]
MNAIKFNRLKNDITILLFSTGNMVRSTIILIFFLMFLIVLLSGKCSADILINEVMYDPELNENYYEWIELYNPTNKSINLIGWSVTDNYVIDYLESDFEHGNGTIIMHPFSYALITDHGTKFYDNYSTPNCTIKLYVDDSAIGNGLGNGGDKLILKNNENKIIDTVEWIVNYSDIPGTPAFAVKENYTLSRISNFDRNDSILDFYESSTPTPGSKNIIIEEGKTEINCNQSYFLVNKNENLKIILKVTNLGRFNDNITIKISKITDGWKAKIENQIIQLAPNESIYVNTTIIPCRYNCYNTGKLTFIALSEKEVEFSGDVTLTFEIFAPDLYIKQIKGYNEEGTETSVYGEGQIIRIKSFLKNQGLEEAEDVDVSFYLDNINSTDYLGSKYYDLVGKYQKYPSIKIDTHGFSAGKHKIIVIADEKDIVDEFNEQNNLLIFPIEIIDTYPEKDARNLLITEVYYHSRPGLYNEFISIFNPSEKDIDISGWYITNEPLDIKTEQTKIIFPNNIKISSKSKLIISENASTYIWETGKKPDFEYNYNADQLIPQMISSKKFIMSNSGKAISLKDTHNHTIDFIIYGNTSIDYDFWIGPSIPFSGEGVVLKRNKNKDGFFVDTNTSEDWLNIKKYRIGQSDFPYEKINENGEITTYVSPDCSYNAIVNEIRKANDSIYLNIYEFTDPFLCGELIKALIRDVSVKIFLEGSPIGGISDEEKYILNRIANYGGKIRFIVSDRQNKVYARYAFNHGKYLIIDNKTLIIESCNWAKTGIPKDPTYGNREWGIIVRCENITRYFLNVFFDDWDPKRCDSYQFDNINLTVKPDFFIDKSVNRGFYNPQFKSATIKDNFTFVPVLSPDTSYKTIYDMLNSACKNIYIQQLYFYKDWEDRINPFVDLLVNKSRQGIDIKVILNYNPNYDSTNEKNNQTKKYLENNSIEVKFIYTNWSYFSNVHNKGIIVDNKSILISSINWNENSVINNREVGIIIENYDVVKYYTEVFFYDWNLSSPRSQKKGIDLKTKNEDNKNTIYIVVIFTLTFALIARDWRKRQWQY